MKNPWLTHQFNEAVTYWKFLVDARLAQVDMEEYSPSTKPMRPVPRYTFMQALGLTEDGRDLDPVTEQVERLTKMHGVRHRVKKAKSDG